ncbi:adenylyl cyclase CyaB, putative [Bellilinea caldifistulae]|uniref:class IV adenylate cyclase n=1 Tax=Bellilinea caldifistulae TaxID=360411 RepID=UPI0007820DBF|nr:class IV adenylate cyclase [Bellilinea caldifistulae]GAP09258.1 adenylyl cyclase CyaB, putative [Bellilinea caldifistulae]
MNHNDMEIEAKFFLRDLSAFRRRLENIGAVQVKPRHHELNWRFDLPDGSLTRAHRVLRLRQDGRPLLTYKGAGQAGAEVAVRQEVEVEVSDAEACRRLLEALGYQVSMMYEKYRTTYRLGEAEIVLDEMPFGLFCEIEAPDADTIHQMARRLNLNWEARIAMGYYTLFEQLKTVSGLSLRDLTFENFRQNPVDLRIIGITYADA